MRSIFLCFLLLLCLVIVNSQIFVYAATPEVNFNAGNDLFRKGDFKGAVDNYNAALESGIRNPDLFFNLANAYFRLNDIGRAVQFYEKALRISPRAADIKYNLAIAKSLVKDEISNKSQNIFVRIIQSFYGFLNLKEFIYITSILFATAFIFFFLTIMVDDRIKKFAFVISGIFLLFIMSIFLFTTIFKTWEYNYCQYAVILPEKVNIRSGPKDSFTTVFTLHSGTEVRIREVQDGWTFISLPNGMNGWMESRTDNQETLGII
jgi:tetratricopeptide (TPR) repeat protein